MPPRSSTSLPQRTTLTYRQRLQICEHARANPEMRMSDLSEWAALQFRLPKPPSESSIRKTRANEDQWRQAVNDAVDEGAANNMRRKGAVQAPEVEAALVKWLGQQPRDAKVKGREIQAKAEELAVTMGIDEAKRPKFSKGWLSGFQERYSLNGKTSATVASRKRPSLSEPIPSRIVLTYKQRKELCDYAEANATLNKTQLAEWATKKFHLRKYISNHAVSSIIKRADEWKRVSSKEAKTRRHWREPMAPELDTFLATWVNKQRERSVKVKGQEIIEQGRMIANELGMPADEQPKFSKGWLQSFMTRHGLTKTRLPKVVRDAANREFYKPADGSEGDDVEGDDGGVEEGEDDGDGDGEDYDDEYLDADEQEALLETQDTTARKKARVEHLLNH